MSKVVDERVVSLQFDNRNFEKNIQGTLSTLDNFNKKLKLDGAAKGIEHVNDAVKKVDMNPMAKGVETVVAKFSALDVMAVTALTRITNAALDAGKKMVSALLIEPKSDGFKEYELMLNAIQTTMAGTGKTAKQVEDELKRLDEYADKTVYSTADMLNNLPKFTNAGVELEKATTAMIGIANATAHAGGDAGKASIAFYNLGQAIGTGYLSRMDYNSINNAGIATMEWKNQMVEAAIAQGTLTKVGEDSYKAGKKTLTLQQLFIDGLQEQWATTDVMMKVFGDYGDETTEIGKKAYESAQNIKTFTQMMESLKATAGTGWKDTWQIIFGDLPEATKMWTSVSNAISGVLTSMADFRNSVLESALGKGFSNLAKRINGVLKPVAKTADNVSKVVDAVKDYNKVVDEIIAGKWGNEKKRWDALTEAGYDWAHAQNLVNEKLGDGTRHATKYSEAQNKVDQSQKNVTKTTGKQIAELVKKSDAELKSLGYTNDQIDALRELQKEADKTGYSIEEFVDNIDNINGRSLLLDSFANIGQSLAAIFTAIKDAFVDIFEITPEGIGQTLYDLIAGFHKLTSKLVVSDETADKMKRTFKGLFAILDIVSTIIGGPLKLGFKVLSEILGMFDLNIWDVTAKIGDAIVAFRDWLDSITDFSDKFDNVKKVFDTFAEGGSKVVDAVKSLGIVKDTINKVRDAVTSFVDKINIKFDGSFIDRFCETISNAFDSLAKWIASLNDVDTENVGQNIMSGLVNGITNGAKAVWDAITGAVNKVIEIVCDILGIHSPSTVMEEHGKNTIQGFVNGLSEGAKAALDAIAEIFRAVAAFFPQFKLLNSLALLIPVIKRLGSDTSSGFVQGLSEGAKQIFSTISEIFNAVIEKVKDILGIHSPSVVMMSIGKFLIAGLVLGIVGSKTGLFDALGGVIDWIKEKFGELKEYLGSIEWPEIKMEYILGAGALVGLVVFVKKLLDITTSFANGVEAFGKGVETFSSVAKKLTSGLEPIKKGKFESIANNVLKLSIAIGILAGCVYLLAQLDYGKLWSAVGAIVVLAGVVVGIGALINAIDLQGKEFGKFSLMLLSMSASLWIMASALKKLEFLKEDGSGKMLTGLAIMIFGLGVLLAAMGTFIQGDTAVNIDKAGVTILKISAALLLMTYVVKLLGQLDRGTLIQGGVAIASFGIMVGFLIKTTQFAGDKIDEAGSTILKISAAIGLMALTAKLMGNMSPEEWKQGMLSIAMFSVMVGFLVKITNLAAGNDVQKVGGTILAVGGAMALMALTAVICSMMSPEGFWKGIGAIAAFAVIIAGLIWATKLATEKELKGVARTLLAASLAIGIMSLCAVILSMVSLGGLLKGGIAVAAFGGIIIALIAVTKNANDVHKNITSIAIAIGVMAAAIVVLSFIDPTKMANAVAAMMILMGMFAIILSQAKNVNGSMGVLIVMTAAIAVMAGMIAWLASLPVESVIGSAIALGGLMLAMSGALFIVSKIGKKAKDALLGVLGLLAMAVPLAAFVGVLALMQNVQNAANNAMVLTALATAMTLLLIPLTIIGAFGTSGLPYLGVLALLTMAIPLVAFVGVLALMQNIQNAANNAMVLTALATAMTLLLVPLTIIGAAGMAGLPYLGVLALLAMAVPLVAFVGILAIMENLQNAITNAEVLINLMTSMTAMLVVLAIVGPLALIGVTAMAALEALMIATGEMALAAAALMKIPGFKEFLDSGIEMLKRLAQGVGEIISSFAVGLTSGLPEVGTNLSNFMNNLSGFISGANSINDGLGEKIKTLAAAIVTLTAADLIAGISSMLQNGSSFAQLGADLSAFMTNAMPFMTGLSMVNPESLTAVKALAEAILILTGTQLLESLASWLTGGSSLADFGAELAVFGPYMAAYAAAVAGIDCAAVEASAKAAKSLAEMAAALPNEGGVVGWFMGENDMTTFGTQIVAFGTALKLYSVAVTGLLTEPIMQSVEAGKALAELADSIPNLGGVASWFAGDNDFATFGTQIIAFGSSIKEYSLMVAGILIDPIMQSVEAGKALAGLNEAIPNLGGMVSWFTGDNDFASFGTQIVAFGASLLAYSTTVVGLNLEAISSSVKAATQLSKLADALPSDGGFWSLFKDDKIDFNEFGNQIKKLGEGLQGYSDKVASMNASAVSTSISSARQLVSLIKSMGDLDASGIDAFSSAIGKLGKTSVDKFVKAFTSSTSQLNNIGSNLIKAVANGAKSANSNLTSVVNATVKAMNNAFSSKQSTFKTLGAKLMTAFISGINSKKTKVNTAMKAVAERGVKGARDKYNSFYKAGSYVVSGFVKGINDNKYKATRAGTALGKAAYEAAKKAIDSNSPSKKFMELGKFSDQGLAKGLTLYSYLATRAAGQLGDDIVKSMQKTLGIHSPAKVVKDDVGQYVVQGLAEGITADMSAEEAAKKKADNIVSAFKDEFDKLDVYDETAKLNYEKWLMTDGVDASEADRLAHQINMLADMKQRQITRVNLAQAEYNETLKYFGQGSLEAQEAYNKLAQEQMDLADITDKLSEAQGNTSNTLRLVYNEAGRAVVKGIAEGITADMSAEEAAEKKAQNIASVFQDEFDKLDVSDTTADLKYQLWLDENKNASDGEKTAAAVGSLMTKYNNQLSRVKLAEDEYLATLETFGEGTKETKDAFNKWLQEQVDLNDISDEISTEMSDATERMKQEVKDKLDMADSTADLEYSLWEVHNESATAAEKTAQKAALIYKRIGTQTERVATAQQDYESKFEQFGADAIETQEAYNTWVQEQITLNDETKKLLDLRAESIAQANDAAETLKSTADLEYEKWELNNQDASDALKASKKLEFTLEKIDEQAGNVGRAKALWEDAKARYGDDSIEANKAYNEYLKADNELVKLTNEVTGTYKDAITAQQIARTEYYDLIREEGKKRLEWGWTQEQIETWARKKTGYDPALLEELMTNDVKDTSTNAAAIVESTYTECMKNSLGTVGIEAGTQLGENVATGVESTVPGIQSAVQTATDVCVTNASEQETTWVNLGASFVQKFAEGITNTVSMASEAAVSMVTSAYQAAINFINDSESNGYSITPRVTPILDLSNIQNGVGRFNGLLATNTMMLADVNVRLTNDSITELSELTEKMRLSNEANHTEIISAIKNLKGDFNSLVNALEGMHVRLDGGAVVGELIGKIDTGLGQIVNHKGRGN